MMNDTLYQADECSFLDCSAIVKSDSFIPHINPTSELPQSPIPTPSSSTAAPPPAPAQTGTLGQKVPSYGTLPLQSQPQPQQQRKLYPKCIAVGRQVVTKFKK
jgi:hypothetical protein